MCFCGLLICKSNDDVYAQYSLEDYNQPLGISGFEGVKKMSLIGVLLVSTLLTTRRTLNVVLCRRAVLGA